MIDLQLSCGLPLKFDEVAEKFSYGDDIVCRSINRVPLSSMIPGLLNKSLRYPQYVYLEHLNIHRKEDEDIFASTGMNYDILMLPAGLMGVEFIRSHIFYSCQERTSGVAISEIVEVVSGELTVLLQKNMPKEELDFETRVSEGLVVKLKEGEKFMVPQNYYYIFINTKEQPVVFSRFYKEGNICDYSQLRKEQGLAYYAIRKNAKQEIVLNPRYREIPKIKKAASPEGLVQLKEDVQKSLSSEPLYAQLIGRGGELAGMFA